MVFNPFITIDHSLIARHFNSANHSISDIKICALSSISGGNDSRKRQERRFIFKLGTTHPHGSTNVFLSFNHLMSFCFCLAWADRNISLYTVFPWFCFHFYHMQFSIPLGSLTASACAGLLIAVKNSK